jgi:uncharacterized damage-inducible protein DinB
VHAFSRMGRCFLDGQHLDRHDRPLRISLPEDFCQLSLRCRLVPMTSAIDLRALYDYCYWANAKLLAVVSQLTQKEFTQSIAGSYGSVQNTLVHMLSAEWGWLDRCGGAQRGPALVPADYPTAATLIDRWQQVETHMRAFLSSLRNEDLSRIVQFSIGSGPKQAMLLGELMHHGAIHGIHHRGQVALLLRSLGHAPGNFDILFYYGQRSSAAAP